MSSDQHPWMVAILLSSPLARGALCKLLGTTVERREGRHNLAITPDESFLCRRGEMTLWVDHFRSPWKDTSGEDAGVDSPMYSQDVADDHLIADPWCLRRSIEQHRGAPEAATHAEKHCEYVLLRVPLQPGGHSTAGYEALLELAHVLLAHSPHSVFFNPRAEVLGTEQELRQAEEAYHKTALPPIDLLVHARTFGLAGGWALADSVGLSQLELPDQEVAFNEPAMGRGQAVEFVRNLAKHLITHRTPVENGDTAGGPNGTLWEAMLLGRATLAPHRRIIRWLPENREGMPPDLQVP